MCLTNLFSSQLTHKNITTMISFLARSVESSWLCFNKFFQHDLECFQQPTFLHLSRILTQTCYHLLWKIHSCSLSYSNEHQQGIPTAQLRSAVNSVWNSSWKVRKWMDPERNWRSQVWGRGYPLRCLDTPERCYKRAGPEKRNQLINDWY